MLVILKFRHLIAEGLSSDTPFHLGSTVNTTMEPGMTVATIPKYRVGIRGEELLTFQQMLQ
jgi:hypothetical protein